MGELVVMGDYLQACQGWQGVINAESTIAGKNAAGDEAVRTMSGRTFHDDRRVIVAGEAAIYLPDGSSDLEEKIWPYMQFGELKTSGWLGRLNYIQMREEAFLAWGIYDPRVLGPTQEEVIEPTEFATDKDPAYYLPIDKPLKRTLHFPVGLINYALPYSK